MWYQTWGPEWDQASRAGRWIRQAVVVGTRVPRDVEKLTHQHLITASSSRWRSGILPASQHGHGLAGLWLAKQPGKDAFSLSQPPRGMTIAAPHRPSRSTLEACGPASLRPASLPVVHRRSCAARSPSLVVGAGHSGRRCDGPRIGGDDRRHSHTLPLGRTAAASLDVASRIVHPGSAAALAGPRPPPQSLNFFRGGGVQAVVVSE